MLEFFNRIIADVGRAPVVAAWFTGAGTLFAAIVSAAIAYLVAHRSVYINAVTAERSKWIEALRSTISKYSGAAIKVSARHHDGSYPKKQDRSADTELLQTLLTDLTLRLNPNEPEAKNLLKAAVKLDAAARLHSSAAVILANEIMIRHAQWAAKAEWERVKQEASGWIRGLWFVLRNDKRRRAYKRFLRQDGSMHRLEAIGAGKSDLELTLLRSQMDAYGPLPTLLSRFVAVLNWRPILPKPSSWAMRMAVVRLRFRRLIGREPKVSAD